MSGMVGVEIIGVDKVKKILKPYEDKVNYDKTVEEIAELAAQYARGYAPRDTGNLEKSIIVEPAGEMSYQVICGVPYAIYNEYGCYNIPLGYAVSRSGKYCYRPFMRTGARKAITFAGKIFGSKLHYSTWK